MTLTLKNRALITAMYFIIVLLAILWEYFNGGVIEHHILHDDSMPAITNWWGLFTIPLATWLSLVVLKNRTTLSRKEWHGFLGGLLFGTMITVLFYTLPDHTGNLLLLTFGLALFLPLGTAEYYLGFFLSMVFGFGGVLPVVFGLVIITIYGIEYYLIRNTFLKILNKL